MRLLLNLALRDKYAPHKQVALHDGALLEKRESLAITASHVHHRLRAYELWHTSVPRTTCNTEKTYKTRPNVPKA